MAGTYYAVWAVLVSFACFASYASGLPLSNDTKTTTAQSTPALKLVTSAPDLATAGSKHKHVESSFGKADKFGGDSFDADKDDEGFFKTHDSNSDDGYKKLGKFAKKDGDTYGFEEHTVYGKKNHGDNDKNLAYHHTTSYDIDDAKKEGSEDSDKPAFREWHFESNSKSPSKHSSAVFEDDEASDEAVDEAFASKKADGSKKMKRSKGVQAFDDEDSKSGKAFPFSNAKFPGFDEEAYVSRKTKRSKKPHPDVEVSGNMSPFGPRFQSLPDVSPEGLRRKQSRKTKREKKDPALSATDDLNYYDDGDDAAFAALEEGEEEAEGADYDEYPENEADEYY